MTDITKKEIGLERITPSMLVQYTDCPKLFYYRDWLGIRIPSDMRHLNFGTSIHEGIDKMYSMYDFHFGGAWEGQEFESVEKTFTDKWNKYPIDYIEFSRYKSSKKGQESSIASPEELHKQMLDDGVAMLRDLWNQKELLVAEYGVDVSATEIPVKMPMIDPTDDKKFHPIPISMRIDGRTLSNVTIEFKTSGGRYNEEDTRKKLQGRSYAFEEFQNYQNYNPRVIYIVLLKGVKTDGNRVQVIDLHYDKTDMEIYYNEVGTILQKIANREFEAPLNGHMPYCECRKYEELLSVD